MAVRLLSRDEVHRRLTELGCRKTKGQPLKTAEIWQSPSKHFFTVPMEGPDGRCDEYAFQRIVDEIEHLRPKGP